MPLLSISMIQLDCLQSWREDGKSKKRICKGMKDRNKLVYMRFVTTFLDPFTPDHFFFDTVPDPAPGLTIFGSSALALGPAACSFKNSCPRIRKNSSRRAALRELALMTAMPMSPTKGMKPTPAETALLKSMR